ncbi:hypothetical protein ACFL54_00195 [Planctomycetota bacterium]
MDEAIARIKNPDTAMACHNDIIVRMLKRHQEGDYITKEEISQDKVKEAELEWMALTIRLQKKLKPFITARQWEHTKRRFYINHIYIPVNR